MKNALMLIAVGIGLSGCIAEPKNALYCTMATSLEVFCCRTLVSRGSASGMADLADCENGIAEILGAHPVIVIRLKPAEK
jgi:hypothetical protein